MFLRAWLPGSLPRVSYNPAQNSNHVSEASCLEMGFGLFSLAAERLEIHHQGFFFFFAEEFTTYSTLGLSHTVCETKGLMTING